MSSTSSVTRVLAIALIGGLLSGCAPGALNAPRQQLATRHYAAAHRELVAVLANPGRLSPDELREARDDLCRTEFMIGPPTYPLREQRRTCAAAASVPGSRSVSILDRINYSMRTAAARRVELALASRDVPDAVDAADEYSCLPGADSRQKARWARIMWAVVHERDTHTRARQRRFMRRTVAKLRSKYAAERRMTRRAFLRWVAKQGTVNGRTIFYAVGLKRSRLELLVRRADVRTASLNLMRLGEVNDALAARCGCSAHTDVARADTGFPLYEVSVVAEIGRSQVLVLSNL